MQTDAALGRRGLAPFAPLRQASDQALVEQARAGSDSAFEALFSRHRRSLLAYCQRMLGSIEEAEDAVQLTFMAAYRDLMRAEQPRAWRPWLYGIARHRCLSALRVRRERVSETVPEPALDRAGAELAARAELRAVLADMALLPHDQRIALVLAEFGDLSHEEIAEVLQCRRERVKALVFQARTALAAHRAARETPCAEIRKELATLRGAALRRATLRRHLSGCAACGAFAEEMRSRRRIARVLVPATPVVGLERGILGTLFGAGSAGGSAIISGALGTSGLVAVALTTVAIHGGSHRAAPTPSPPRSEAARVVGAPSIAAASYGAALAIAFRDQAQSLHGGPRRHGHSMGASAPPADVPSTPARPSKTEPDAGASHAASAASPAGEPDGGRAQSAAHVDAGEASGDSHAGAAQGVSAHGTPPAAQGHDASRGANGPPESPPGQAGRDHSPPKEHVPGTKPDPTKPHPNTAPSRPKPDAPTQRHANTPPSAPKVDAPTPPTASAPPRDAHSNSPASPKPDPQRPPPDPSAPPGQSGSSGQTPGGPSHPGH